MEGLIDQYKYQDSVRARWLLFCIAPRWLQPLGRVCAKQIGTLRAERMGWYEFIRQPQYVICLELLTGADQLEQVQEREQAFSFDVVVHLHQYQVVDRSPHSSFTKTAHGAQSDHPKTWR